MSHLNLSSQVSEYVVEQLAIEGNLVTSTLRQYSLFTSIKTSTTVKKNLIFKHALECSLFLTTCPHVITTPSMKGKEDFGLLHSLQHVYIWGTHMAACVQTIVAFTQSTFLEL